MLLKLLVSPQNLLMSYAKCILAVALWLLIALAAHARSADFYVASNGNDSWSGKTDAPNLGKTDGPLASLAHARDAVRALKQAGAKDITVLIRGGNYALSETVVFGLQDSGSSTQTIIYKAYPGETPVITSDVSVMGWTKRPAEPASTPGIDSPSAGPVEPQLPNAAQGHIWEADIPAGLGRIMTLYVGNQKLKRAASEPFGPTNTLASVYGNGTTDMNTIHYPAGQIRNWRNIEDAEIRFVPAQAWHMGILPLKSVDEAKREAITAIPATYGIGASYGKFSGKNMVLENILNVLDKPGEWVVDTQKRKICYWPKDGKPEDNIVAPRLKEFIRVEGKIDYDGPVDTPVRNLHFVGLTFAHGERDAWAADYPGWNLQHSWEMFDRANAMIRFRGAEDCSIEKCHLVNTGGTGIRLDLHNLHNRIAGNEIKEIGGAGILLAGYGGGTKNVNRENEIVDNEISKNGTEYWDAIAIMVWQSEGNHIAHNLIHDTPYIGLTVSGRLSLMRGGGECYKSTRWNEIPKEPENTWEAQEQYLHARKNIVEYNEFYNNMVTMCDGNAIYVSGCGRDNIVRRNYIHDLTGEGVDCAIRCDDLQNETTITENVIVHINHGGIVLKGRNYITNNVLIDVASLNPTPYSANIMLQVGDVTGSVIQRNILYSTAGNDTPYWEGFIYGKAAWLRETKTDNNLYFSPAKADWATKALEKNHASGVDQHSLQADPLFRNLAKRDFRFRKDSPAKRLGIREIDMSGIGIRR